MDEITQLAQQTISTQVKGELQQKFDLLAVKESALIELNASIEELTIEDEDFNEVLTGSQAYEDKICLAKSVAKQVLSNPPTDAPLSSNPRNRNSTSVKLPKLEISKFDGDLRNWESFWDQFDSTIHSNESLSMVDKLKGYLTGKAMTVIKELSLSEENYSIAIDLLKDRFGKKSLIIDEHMTRLLNLPKVSDSSEVTKLRELYDEVRTGIRCLEALSVAHSSYGVLLLSVLRKAVPADINLEYERKHCDKDDLDSYLTFLNLEVTGRERGQRGGATKPNVTNIGDGLSRRQQNNFPSGVTLAVGTEHTRCVFCESTEHSLQSCTVPLSLQEKKEKL
ncbi:uncharacterized protein LOC135400935 [Ornithodoros turicata]|uniref:uncharacterized protein LOC135400935 n=1 Tax=Ornithodoros turicata TaxID=34597 RepID=UPI0031392E91